MLETQYSDNLYTSESNIVDISEVQAAGAVIVVPINICSRAHVFIGYTFTDDNGNVVSPTSGNFSVKAKTLTNDSVFESITSGDNISASLAPARLSVLGNIKEFEITGAGIDVATKMLIKIAGNEA